MNRICLHNYAASPFAEKGRLLLSFKRLPWAWVEVPNVLPKPDLVALTGGYRKTPVMQIGRDIYCDTRIMQLYLEKLQPEPSYFVPGQEGLSLELSSWADTTWFRTIVSLCFSERGFESFRQRMSPEQLEALVADRRALRGGAPLPAFESAYMAFRSYARNLDAQLAKSSYLLGDRLSLVDLSHYHPLFLLGNVPTVAVELDPYPHVRAWVERIRELGWGDYEPMTGEAAIALAESSDSWTDPIDPEPLPLPHVELGDQVTVAPTDSGTGDGVTGELVIASANEIAVRRSDPRAGQITVHFPTVDFSVVAA